MKCLIHIGTEKTGTTAIQAFLYENRTKLRHHGIYITDSFGIPNNRYIPAYFCQQEDDFNLIYGLKTQNDKDNFFQDFDANFEEEMEAANGCHTLLLSSEHFHSRLRTRKEIKNLKKFLKKHFKDIQILCYFREQSDMIISQYSTGLKGRESRDFASFAEEFGPETYHFNFLKIAENWSSVFGVNNCVFRIYDSSILKSNDIRIDFLDAVGIDLKNSTFTFRKTGLNSSLSPMQSAAFRAINKAIPYWQPEGGVNPRNLRAKKAILRVQSFQSGSLSSPLQKRIFEKFAESNAQFLDRFFEGDTNFNFKERTNSSKANISSHEIMNLIADITYELSIEIADKNDASNATVYSITKLSYFIEWVDYRIHTWLSKSRFLPKSINLRFKAPAERRRQKLRRL